jgi:hypothetical protein
MLPASAFCQNSLNDLLERSQSEGNIEQLLEELQELRKNKIPINQADADELLVLPFINASDAEKIIKWRQDMGAVSSAEELETVIGSAKAELIAPYLLFVERKQPGPQGFLQQLKGSLSSRFFREIPERRGIETGKYAGENYRLYNRLKADIPHFGFSALQENDIGEPETDDFSSLSIHVEDLGVVKRAVIGNYELNFGQGLLFGQGRYFSKGVDAVDGVALSTSGIKPYTSASETGFLQGAASTLALDPFEITAFYSRNKIDASVTDGVVTSILDTGYHRTESEQSKKDILVEEVHGVNLMYRYRSSQYAARLGGTWMRYRYGLPLQWLDNEKTERWSGSFEAEMVFGNVNVFSEAAFAHDPDAVSWICGMQASLTKNISAIAAVRRYDEHYYSPFAGAFAERGDDGSNEDGAYIGIGAKLSKNLQISGYYDFFRFPELSSSFELPADGHDARIYVTWRQSPSLKWYGMYQHKQREDTKIQSDDDGREYVMAVPVTTNRLQLGLEARISPHIDLKTRGEGKFVDSGYLQENTSEKGWLVYEQLNYTSGKFGFRTRFSVFNTDSYDAAIYAYEDDLPLVYSLNTFSGRGRALFILASLEIMNRVRLAAKYETTWYADRDTYGSGNDLRESGSPASFHIGCFVQF